jgi:PRTRC genetic system protein B
VGRLGEWLLVTQRPRRYSFAFTTEQGNEPVNLPVAMPALAFFGYGQKYYLWAFTDRELNANSPLFAAPLPNIEGNGAICFGQNVLPQASTKTIGEAWNLFLTSPFSTHSVNGKSKTFPEDVRKQLEKLAQANVRRYPLRDLVPLRETASQMIDGIVRGIRG